MPSTPHILSHTGTLSIKLSSKLYKHFTHTTAYLHGLVVFWIHNKPHIFHRGAWVVLAEFDHFFQHDCSDKMWRELPLISANGRERHRRFVPAVSLHQGIGHQLPQNLQQHLANCIGAVIDVEQNFSYLPMCSL